MQRPANLAGPCLLMFTNIKTERLKNIHEEELVLGVSEQGKPKE